MLKEFIFHTGNVPGIEDGWSKRHDSDGLLDLRWDVTHPGADDLEDGPSFAADEMELVDDEQIHALNVLSLFPTTRQHVPTLRGRDDHVAWGVWDKGVSEWVGEWKNKQELVVSGKVDE